MHCSDNDSSSRKEKYMFQNQLPPELKKALVITLHLRFLLIVNQYICSDKNCLESKWQFYTKVNPIDLVKNWSWTHRKCLCSDLPFSRISLCTVKELYILMSEALTYISKFFGTVDYWYWKLQSFWSHYRSQFCDSDVQHLSLSYWISCSLL